MLKEGLPRTEEIHMLRALDTTYEKRIQSVRDYFSQITAKTALAAREGLDQLRNHSQEQHNPALPFMSESRLWLEKNVYAKMNAALDEIPFSTHMINSQVDYSGCKHNGTNPNVWAVSKPIDGIGHALRDRIGASSVIAVGEPNGFLQTPERKTLSTLMKLIAPPQAENAISLDNTPRENLDNLIQALNIRPEQLKLILPELDQPRLNQLTRAYIEEARRLKVGGITSAQNGRIMSTVRASLNPREFGYSPALKLGKSNFQDTAIDAAAVKLLGGFMDLREIDSEGKLLDHQPLTASDLAPKPLLVSITPFTTNGDYDEFLRKRGIKNYGPNIRTYVNTLTITKKDLYWREDVHLTPILK